MNGYLAVVLHAHLPHVRHPEYRFALEETWLFEAVLECYLPLLVRFRRLAGDGVPFRVTMSMTPPLVGMLRDDLLRRRFEAHLARMEELAAKEIARTRGDASFERTARFYAGRLAEARAAWASCGGDLVAAFAELERAGHLDILTCGATHGFLPFLEAERGAVLAQVAGGADLHARAFGHRARGIWLPECGYADGIENSVAAAGLRYFVVDAHAIEHATPRVRQGVHAPVYLPNGVAAFGRDTEASKQVWSAEEGYPGDPVYRDFYRDIGFDLPLEVVGPYVHPDGLRIFTGFKYHRVTGRDVAKEPYDPDAAHARADAHAGHFLWCREQRCAWIAGSMDRPPLVVAPYDAELFGHWWFEGPDFLEALFRRMHAASGALRAITLGEYLELHPRNVVARLSPSSWGAGGYGEVWCEGSNAWMWRHVHRAARELRRLLRAHDGRGDGPVARALRQAAREALLLESSDFPFILKTATSTGYAVARFKAHLARFLRLVREIDAGAPDAAWLADLEARDNFPAQFPIETFFDGDKETACSKAA